MEGFLDVGPLDDVICAASQQNPDLSIGKAHSLGRVVRHSLRSVRHIENRNPLPSDETPRSIILGLCSSFSWGHSAQTCPYSMTKNPRFTPDFELDNNRSYLCQTEATHGHGTRETISVPIPHCIPIKQYSILSILRHQLFPSAAEKPPL